MIYSQHLRKPLAEFSSRSFGSGLDSSNNPGPTIKQVADNSNARLGGSNTTVTLLKFNDSDISVAALVGLSLLFCTYLYFLFRPIIRDKNCVAPYDSVRNREATVVEDLEKGMSQEKSEIGGGERPEADVAAHLEKRKLRQWIHRASRGRFFSDPKTESSTQVNSGKAKQRTRCDRNRSRMPIICVSPPPPVYGSDGIIADPIYCLSDSHSGHIPQEPSGEKTLFQYPTHALQVPTKVARAEPNHHSLIQSSISGNTKGANATHTVQAGKTSDRCGGGRIRTILSRSITM
jgi:hypothetical protein